MTQEALKLSQEALAGLKDVEKQVRELVAENKALKETLAQTQEPVATVESVATVVSESGNQEVTMSWWHEPALPVGTKLYTTPQQRTEQEPFCLHWEDRWGCNHYADPKEPHPVNAKPLYTTPPQRTWVGLTDEEKSDIWCAVTDRDFVTEDTHVYADAIEAKLKEKNT